MISTCTRIFFESTFVSPPPLRAQKQNPVVPPPSIEIPDELSFNQALEHQSAQSRHHDENHLEADSPPGSTRASPHLNVDQPSFTPVSPSTRTSTPLQKDGDIPNKEGDGPNKEASPSPPPKKEKLPPLPNIGKADDSTDSRMVFCAILVYNITVNLNFCQSLLLLTISLRILFLEIMSSKAVFLSFVINPGIEEPSRGSQPDGPTFG